MKFYRPKSVVQLVFIGFLLVTLPLIFALLNATLYVDNLVKQSQATMYQAVKATRNSSVLLDQITAMNRNARQYQVLGDKTIFEVYEKTHEGFQATAKKMFLLPLDEAQWRLLSELVGSEQGLFTTLRDHPYDSELSSAAVAEFSGLHDLASFILTERRRSIDHEMTAMHQTAGKAKRILIWQFVLAGALVLGLAFIFTVLISRPIKKIDQAIRQLGDGEFTSQIGITGPQDLEYLGKRLDWLRVRLVDLEEQKRKFLDHVSHELKTPLSSIREGAELLSDEVGGPLNHEQQKVVSILRENSIQLQRIIENMINFRAALLRHTALYLRQVNISSLIEKVAADHELAMMVKNIKLELRLADVTVAGDTEKLMTIIDNLFSNAVKFSPEGGIIKVSLIQNGNQVLLDIMDSGPGIDPSEREKVFEPFYQGRITPDGHVKGTGIGLSVVAEYVRMHGGSIHVVDSQANRANFRVMLPVQIG